MARSHFDSQVAWMAAADLLCLGVGIACGVAARLGPESIREYIAVNLYGWVYFAASVLLANYVVGTYGLEIRASRFNLLVNWVFSIAVALLVVSATSYAWLRRPVGRGVMGLAIAVYSTLWLSVRVLVYQWLFRRRSFVYRVVIVGAGSLARSLIEVVQHHLIRPVHHVVAVVDLKDGVAREPPGSFATVPVVPATTADVAQVVRGLSADVVLLAMRDEEQIRKAYTSLRRLRFEGLAMHSALGAMELYTGRIPIEMVDEQWLWQASGGPGVLPLMRFKRMVDLLLVIFTLPLTLPLALLTAFAVKVTSLRDPVLYCQERVGRFGRPFTIYKFRTMVQGAERDTGAVWSPKEDARVTPVGRFLRCYRLDELPQLFNVLRGDMSLVGPRPERPELAAELEKQIPYYRERENVPPGLSGWAQIRHPYGSSVEDSRTKLEYDLYYIQNLSLGLDLRIILRTLRIVLFGMEREVR